MTRDARPVITRLLAAGALVAGLWLLLVPFPGEGDDGLPHRCASAVAVHDGDACATVAGVRRTQGIIALGAASIAGLVLLSRVVVDDGTDGPPRSSLGERLRRVAARREESDG